MQIERYTTKVKLKKNKKQRKTKKKKKNHIKAHIEICSTSCSLHILFGETSQESEVKRNTCVLIFTQNEVLSGAKLSYNRAKKINKKEKIVKSTFPCI